MINRPLSPHLQIYRFQLTSVLSITHRATGIGLAIGSPVFVGWLVALGTGPAAYDTFAAVFDNWFGLLLLIGWTWSLFYHLANGIRHLVWDTGAGLDLKSTYASGWAVVVSSILLTVGCWIVACQGWGL